MSEFGRLLDELSVARARPQATTYSRSPPARPLPALRTRADPNFAKSLDAGLTQAEGRIGKHAITMALNSNEDRLADIRSRARQAIERATAEIRELIALGGITAQEVGERQVLLNAFAARMGL